MLAKELQQIMQIDSTSGKEAELAHFIVRNFKTPLAVLDIQEVGDGTLNLFYKWGVPKTVFCTHLDTVPPFIAPRIDGDIVYGRGACDAKGQIITAWHACMELQHEGESNFGLLLTAGEETGSKGAGVANRLISGSEYVVVCEPTENKLIRAGKGIRLYDVTISGVGCHSGYPQFGDDAIEKMRLFLERLADLKLPDDPLLGPTTYNIAQLSSNNALNVVPDLVTMKIYFRTTFATHHLIEEMIDSLTEGDISIREIKEENPQEFYYLEGFSSGVVAFGSDAPGLYNLGKCLLYGAGSIMDAHTNHEFVKISDIEKAITDLKKIYRTLKKNQY